jgi:hypothetical protein
MRARALWRGPVLALLLTAAPAAADSAMQAAATGFYAVYGAAGRQGGLPDATARMRYAKVLSPRLNLMLAGAEAAQVRFSTRVKGAAPPLIEGDLFTSLFEGATGWTVGTCTGDAKGARCPVTLTYRETGQKPVQWHDTLLLAHTDAGWRVDDIVYDPALRSGNTGRLSRLLTMVLAEAPP